MVACQYKFDFKLNTKVKYIIRQVYNRGRKCQNEYTYEFKFTRFKDKLNIQPQNK